jgi:hypothetical protein
LLQVSTAAGHPLIWNSFAAGAYAGRKEDIFQDEYGYLEHLSLQKLNDDLLNDNNRVPTPIDQLLEKAQDPLLNNTSCKYWIR